MQINSVPLSLIIFHKFIVDDEKWILYDNPKRKKWVDSDQPSISTAKPNIHTKKMLMYKDKGIELICTPNKKNSIAF